MSKTAIIILVVGVLVLGAIGATIYFLNQPQENRSRASTPTPVQSFPTVAPSPTTEITPSASPEAQINQACATPTSAQNVLIEFPGCEGDSCLFTQASCSWDPNNDAASYNLTVTEVETGSVVRNESIPNSTTKVLFPITQGRTYKCDITVVNSCGSVSDATSDQLLCQADALIPTTTPTVALTPSPVASSTPTIAPTEAPTSAPISTPTPTLQPGGITPTIGIIGGIIIFIVGGILLLAL